MYWPFSQEFEGHGSFEGRVVAFDGKHYRVYYPEDGDEEELSEYEFDDFGILDADEEESSFASNKEVTQERDEDSIDAEAEKPPKYPVGTRFIKVRYDFCLLFLGTYVNWLSRFNQLQEFPGYGKFEGQVVDYNGERYEVYYFEDGDEEVLRECELDKLEIILWTSILQCDELG